MASVPTGTTFAVATTFAASKTITAVTNAADASFSVTAHGFDVGDVVEITSGWELEEAFNEKNIAELNELYPGASRAIVAAYINEYTGAKAGN